MNNLFVSAESHPFYLGRSLDQWWADFLSAEYVDDIEPAWQAMFRHPIATQVGRAELWKAHFVTAKNRNLAYQALPCFGEAFLRKAAAKLQAIDEPRQTRLVLCIAKTGKVSVPCLVRLLEDSSPNVRVAACLGLGDIIDPIDGELLPEILELRKSFLVAPNVSQEEVDLFCKKDRAILESAEARFAIDAEVPAALIKRLEDDYQSVRLAAVGTVSWLLQNCRVEVSVREEIVSALVQRLEDDCQPVRIAAKNALAVQKVEGSPLRPDDARVYEQVFDPSNHDACCKARREMVDNWIASRIRKLLNDPSPDVRERVARAGTLCKQGGDVGKLPPREIGGLLQVLEMVPSVCQGAMVVRQEAAYALNWLAEQWEYPGEDKNEPELCKEQAKVPLPTLKVQERIWQLAEASREEVVMALHDRDIAIRLAALDALVKMSSTGQDVAGDLFETFNDPCQQVRWRAQQTLTLLVEEKSGSRNHTMSHDP